MADASPARSMSRSASPGGRGGGGDGAPAAAEPAAAAVPEPRPILDDRVRVSGFTARVTEDHVREVFGHFGEITEVVFPADAVSGEERERERER